MQSASARRSDSCEFEQFCTGKRCIIFRNYEIIFAVDLDPNEPIRNCINNKVSFNFCYDGIAYSGIIWGKSQEVKLIDSISRRQEVNILIKKAGFAPAAIWGLSNNSDPDLGREALKRDKVDRLDAGDN